MRLWHIDLIPYLPKSQLIAQWRELNSIFKKQNKHILINYVYDYPKEYLWNYAISVISELQSRDIHIKSNENYIKYFGYLNSEILYKIQYLEFAEHNKEYLTICYWNLREKYLRGQKDFTDQVWQKLDKFYKEAMK